MNSIKLRSLRVVNYLGAGNEGVSVEFDPHCTAICGPNNSGKTTILSAISLLSSSGLRASYEHASFGHAEFISLSGDGHVEARWCPAAGTTDDIFNFNASPKECRFEIGLALSEDLVSFFAPKSGEDSVEVRFSFDVKLGSKRLSSLVIKGEQIFLRESDTNFFRFNGSNAYMRKDHQGIHSVGLIRHLAGRIIQFGSLRTLGSQGGHVNDLYSLANGVGVAEWVRNAMLPDPKDSVSKRRHSLLKKFQVEFATFAQLSGFELSAPSSGTELNVDIRGNPIPLSRIGTGIGECLLMMLVCKLAKDLQPIIGNHPPIDIIIIEEPELHLHPKLQRRFVEYLLDYCSKNDTQLIISTHSPTVLNVVQVAGGRIVRTEWNESGQQIAAHPVSTTEHLLRLFKEIGVSPGDVLQAEKVLWVEGPHDIPAFREWLSKAPSFGNQAVAVVSLGGDDSASTDFDFKAVKEINPNCMVILDSERSVARGAPKGKRQEAKSKCADEGIGCHLTDYRSTESYFSPSALQTVYPNAPSFLDPFTELSKQVPGFSKSHCGKVAAAMTWAEIETTDIGKRIEEFLSR
jgi:energy-coupling factor transporter ATP-binding protein EcfA2